MNEPNLRILFSVETLRNSVCVEDGIFRELSLFRDHRSLERRDEAGVNEITGYNYKTKLDQPPERLDEHVYCARFNLRRHKQSCFFVCDGQLQPSIPPLMMDDAPSP